MSSITISTERKFSATVVPNLFIDHYMPAANGAYVKVYLYLLRCVSGSEVPFSLSLAAEHLDETEKDILRALSYWEKVHVLSLSKEQGALTEITFLDLSNEPFQETSATPAAEDYPAVISLAQYRQSVQKNEAPVSAPVTDNPYAKTAYSEKEMSKLLANKDISWLMNIIEVYLERLLTPQDINLVLFLYDKLKFSKELILHLYEYCISKNKRKWEYIEKVAISWHEQGIDTVEKAEQVSVVYDSCFNAVNKAFSLGRLPGGKEREYINRWSSMHLSPEVIEEACNRTLLQISKPDFKYADKILDNWYRNGVHTLADIKKADEAYAATAKPVSPAIFRDKTLKANHASAAPMTKSAGTYNSYPQRQYSEQELLEFERRLLSK